jgi:aerobic carbon-monoxide dehydrogenase medium subunit
VKPPAFAYHRPSSVSDALDCLRTLDGDVRLLAGGQSLVPMLNFRLARPDHLVDLNGLSELDYIRGGEATIEIGALARHHRLATDPQIRAAVPLLAHGAGSIGHYVIRRRGTLGGSLAHADPAAQLPLLALLLDADVLCRSASGARGVPASDFFQSIMTTALEPGEAIVGVRFPVMPPQLGWGFELFGQRQGDFAIVAVAALLALDRAGRVANLSVAVGGVSSKPVRFDDVTARFLSQRPDDKWLAALADTVQTVCEIEETRIPAIFRKELVHVLTQRATAAALERARKAPQP